MYDEVIEAIRHRSEIILGRDVSLTVDDDYPIGVVEMPTQRISTTLNGYRVEKYSWQTIVSITNDNHKEAYSILESINKEFNQHTKIQTEKYKLSNFDIVIQPRRFKTDGNKIYYQTVMTCSLETALVYCCNKNKIVKKAIMFEAESNGEVTHETFKIMKCGFNSPYLRFEYNGESIKHSLDFEQSTYWVYTVELSINENKTIDVYSSDKDLSDYSMFAYREDYKDFDKGLLSWKNGDTYVGYPND